MELPIPAGGSMRPRGKCVHLSLKLCTHYDLAIPRGAVSKDVQGISPLCDRVVFSPEVMLCSVYPETRDCLNCYPCSPPSHTHFLSLFILHVPLRTYHCHSIFSCMFHIYHSIYFIYIFFLSISQRWGFYLCPFFFFFNSTTIVRKTVHGL